MRMTKRPNACFVSLSFAGLVVLARSLNPIPSRTRPLNSSAPMVLWLKPWESRSLPGLPRTKQFLFTCHDQNKTPLPKGGGVFCLPVGRDNPKLFGHDWRPVCLALNRPRRGIDYLSPDHPAKENLMRQIVRP